LGKRSNGKGQKKQKNGHFYPFFKAFFQAKIDSRLALPPAL